MIVYTFSEARQKFASILNKAQIEGEVLIKRKDGSSFIVKPFKKITSPLNVKGIKIDISKEEIIDILQEVRRGN
ncbi:type II toxin-antitoxin system Phd/YefM family antitoxin [bacterium]|nr:type II toxin-antitoxin system Phd/YefM family antitoxin [bacterium]